MKTRFFAVVGALVGVVMSCRTSTEQTADIAGSWFGQMELRLQLGQHELVPVELTLEQNGKAIRGRWRIVDSVEYRSTTLSVRRSQSVSASSSILARATFRTKK